MQLIWVNKAENVMSAAAGVFGHREGGFQRADTLKRSTGAEGCLAQWALSNCCVLVREYVCVRVCVCVCVFV